VKIVATDGYTLNPGDNPWDEIAAMGDLIVFDRTDSDEVIERAAGRRFWWSIRRRFQPR